MAATKKLKAVSVKISMDGGTDPEGEKIISTRTFSGVNPAVTPDGLLAFGRGLEIIYTDKFMHAERLEAYDIDDGSTTA